ncbi:hypothetical protein CPB84DRAFT_1857860 [Gymnopilus junonius]|uniref:Uncharacterized protein n=1 Tax=Gymnopilus junonius TaxID=109634 RepID=A0A9P5TFL7_GYMJU|nr:hypothetical protein CPB84DRAFT_1857860 [Gymnopilus junonius]
MSELCANYLPPNWEETVCTQLLGMKMKQNDKFWDWCQELCTVNIILWGTPSHLSDTALHNQLEAALKPSLLNYCFQEKINKIIVLKDWVLAVKEADKKLKDDRKWTCKVLAEEAAHNSKHPALSGNSHARNTSSAGASSSSNPVKKCPKLEDSERTLLAANNGCFKCQWFNQDHNSKNCPNNFPDGEGYKKVTAMCDAAGNSPKRQTNSSSSLRMRPVAAVIPEAVQASESDEEDVIATIMPSAILGNGTDSKDDVSPSFHSKHLSLKFKILAHHLDFMLIFTSLLDCGVHLVLISPETADELQLERFPLKKPETISVAISKGKKKIMSLSQYVKLSVTTLDNAWTSKTVHALIAPGLCMPIILGLPFLSHNKLIIDADARTCIDKTTGYDLLNLSVIVPPPPPRMKSVDQIKSTKSAKKHVLAEIIEVGKKRMEDGKLTFEDIKPINAIGAICDAVEKLATIEQLQRHGDKVKKDFREIFEPIPHIDDLPMDYLAHIKLKDAEA